MELVAAQRAIEARNERLQARSLGERAKRFAPAAGAAVAAGAAFSDQGQAALGAAGDAVGRGVTWTGGQIADGAQWTGDRGRDAAERLSRSEELGGVALSAQ